MILVGEVCLWIAVVMAAWAATVSLAAGALHRGDLAASGRRGLYVAAAALAVATAGVVDGLVRRDFSLAYVVLHTSLDLPTPYAVAALWSGPAGTMLVWALALSLIAAGLAWRGARRAPGRRAWTAGVVALFLLFPLLVVTLQANPYARLSWAAGDGQGLDPRLRASAMVLQRPLLVFGYAAACIPAVLVLGALLARRADDGMWTAARRWAVAAWTSLGAAILLAARGALASAGAWTWPPDVAVPLAEWAVTAVVLHLPARGRPDRPLVNTNILAAGATALGALAGAYALAAAAGPEALFEPASGASAPAWTGAGVVLAGAVCYLAATRRGALAGSRPASPGRRVTAIVAHAAAAVLALGLAGSLFATRNVVTLRTGQEARVADPMGGTWRFVSQGVSRSATPDADVWAAPLEVSRDDAPAALLVAERLQFHDAQGDSVFAPVVRPAVRASPVLSARAELLATDGDRVELRVTFVPLAAWIWVGGVVLVLAGAVSLWPNVTPPGAAAEQS